MKLLLDEDQLLDEGPSEETARKDAYVCVRSKPVSEAIGCEIFPITLLLEGEQCSQLLSLAIEKKDRGYFEELLVHRNLKIDSVFDGKTALHVACQSNQVEVVNKLLDRGATPTIGDKNGNTCLHVAVHNKHSEVFDVLMRDQKRARRLLNKSNNAFQTALHLAAGNNDAETVRRLLIGGAKLNKQDKDGNTCLHVAAENNNIDVLEELLGCKLAALELVNNRGQTVLYSAARQNNDEAVELLLDHGADATISDRKHWELVSHVKSEEIKGWLGKRKVKYCRCDMNYFYPVIIAVLVLHRIVW